MWMVEEALPGRLSKDNSHHGPPDETLRLYISGRRVYQLQKYLEERAAKGGEFFEVRMLVMMHESLREAVETAQNQKDHERITHGSTIVQREKVASVRE